MTWVDLHQDILEVFAEDAPTVLYTVINPRTRELTCPGLWVTTSPVVKRARDAAWKAANPERVKEYRKREYAKRKARQRVVRLGPKQKPGPKPRVRYCKKCGKETKLKDICPTHKSQEYRLSLNVRVQY